MKRKTSLVILGMVLCVLLVQGLMQSGHAYVSLDCETNRWDAFMNANNQYSSTFYSWYLGQPVSCNTECQSQCNGLSGAAWTTCMSDCIATCNNTRYNAFDSAQDALISAANQSCPFNLDECAAARARRDGCVSTVNGQLENPILDGSGNPDQEWLNMIATEYGSCLAASGVSGCE